MYYAHVIYGTPFHPLVTCISCYRNAFLSLSLFFSFIIIPIQCKSSPVKECKVPRIDRTRGALQKIFFGLGPVESSQSINHLCQSASHLISDISTYLLIYVSLAPSHSQSTNQPKKKKRKVKGQKSRRQKREQEKKKGWLGLISGQMRARISELL